MSPGCRGPQGIPSGSIDSTRSASGRNRRSAAAVPSSPSPELISAMRTVPHCTGALPARRHSRALPGEGVGIRGWVPETGHLAGAGNPGGRAGRRNYWGFARAGVEPEGGPMRSVAQKTWRPRAGIGVTAVLALTMAGAGGPALAGSGGPALAGSGGPALGGGSAVRAASPSWPVAGQNVSDTHDQPDETAISAGNAGQLTTKWSLTTAGDVTATPTVTGGVVYFPDMGGMLWAVNAGTGQVIWSNPLSAYTGIAGDVSRTSPAIAGSELIAGDGWDHNTLTAGAHVFAVDRTTGKLLWLDSVDSNPTSIITGSPVVSNGVAYVGISSKEEDLASQPGYKCCTFRGAVVALNVTTGKMLWKAYMVPSNNGGGDSNKPGYYAGGAVWGSSPVVDPATGGVYIGTGNDYQVPTGVCTMPGQKGCKTAIKSDYFDSIMELKISTGAVVWADRTSVGDAWAGGCTAATCGPDFDFGSMPNLFTPTGGSQQLLGIGQKSGIYWAVNPATGAKVWHTHVGPGGNGGGIEWGSATDGTDVYVAETDSQHKTYTVGGSGPFKGEKISYGSWAALDAATGTMLWQTPDPQKATDPGFVTAANGVVYAGSNATTGDTMYALNAGTGAVLWSFASGGSVRSGAAIVSGMVYWGSGYTNAPNDKFYAFGLPSGGRR